MWCRRRVGQAVGQLRHAWGHQWMSTASTADVVVIGGGIVGVSIAREWAMRHPQSNVIVLEKETDVAQHGSGRNSGVIHAGFYYGENSLRAQFCRQGNQYLHRFCDKHGLDINRCGKLVVAQSPDVVQGLHALYERGQHNGVPLELITPRRAAELEPLARTHEAALWSPSTATADCTQVTRAVAREAQDAGVDICTSTPFVRVEMPGHDAAPMVVHTGGGGTIEAGHVVNAAGLYADKVAHAMGFAQDYSLLPFKGLYLYCNVPLRRLLYPVPDARTNVLGVHYTVTVDGAVKIGPSASPAFWRENYSGMDNFRVQEMLEVVGLEASLLLRNNFGFAGMAWSEIKKYWKPNMIGTAKDLVVGARDEDFTSYGKPGIRAQLVHKPSRSLVMDFEVQGDSRSTHVLNAVSPAWTCSQPFAAHVCDGMDRKGV